MPGDDVPALARAWGLTVEGPERRTFSGTVCFVRRGSEHFVLKLPRAEGDETNAPAVLGHFDGQGAVRLIAADGPAHLVERAMPGEPLTDLVLSGRDDEATAIVCAVAARLHGAGRPAFAVPIVADWGEGFARYRAGGGTGFPGTCWSALNACSRTWPRRSNRRFCCTAICTTTTSCATSCVAGWPSTPRA